MLKISNKIKFKERNTNVVITKLKIHFDISGKFNRHFIFVFFLHKILFKISTVIFSKVFINFST